MPRHSLTTSAEQRPAGLDPEQRLTGLDPEQLAHLEVAIRKKLGGSQ